MTVRRDAVPTAQLAIQFDEVSVWVANGPTILDDISWHVGTGQRWALLGPNGSGKSTTLALAGAVRHPSKGRVSVLGSQFGKTDIPKLRESIGYVESGAQSLDWLTAEEVVLTGIGSTLRPLWWKYSDADRVRARDMLDLLGCGDLASREIKTCSQGERGRIRIARSLITQPRLLLLDEPAVGLDLAAREALMAALDRLSIERPEMTSVIVSHHLEELPGSTTHALLLQSGRSMANGPIHDVLTSDSLSACFGLPVICRHATGERWFARATASWAQAQGRWPVQHLEVGVANDQSHELTHFDASGRARMVDVGGKDESVRIAVATGRVEMQPETVHLVREGRAAKGDVLAVAQVAAIMGAKRTPELIPMCHPLMLTGVEVEFDLQDRAVLISATVSTRGRTGVEMEALTAVAAASLTIYDMLKAVDRGMVIGPIQLERKEGGRSGAWEREPDGTGH